ncbi:MAG: hypothetical protein U5P10_13595 [Spirochaetia bacterium]|nr:hypothetical protein [Spirochaetia bacterium]
MTITLEPISGSDNGTLDDTINFPTEEVDDVVVTVDPWPIGGGDEFTLMEGPTTTKYFFSSGTLEITTDLSAGYYFVEVVFQKTCRVPGERDPPTTLRHRRANLFELDQQQNPHSGNYRFYPAACDTNRSDGHIYQRKHLYPRLDRDAHHSRRFPRLRGKPHSSPEAELGAADMDATSAELSYAGNAGEEISYSLVAYNLFGESPPVSITITPTIFSTNWQTNLYDWSDTCSPPDTIRLPLVDNGDYNFTVYWGDGTSDAITAWDDTKDTHICN